MKTFDDIIEAKGFEAQFDYVRYILFGNDHKIYPNEALKHEKRILNMIPDHMIYDATGFFTREEKIKDIEEYYEEYL